MDGSNMPQISVLGKIQRLAGGNGNDGTLGGLSKKSEENAPIDSTRPSCTNNRGLLMSSPSEESPSMRLVKISAKDKSHGSKASSSLILPNGFAKQNGETKLPDLRERSHQNLMAGPEWEKRNCIASADSSEGNAINYSDLNGNGSMASQNQCTCLKDNNETVPSVQKPLASLGLLGLGSRRQSSSLSDLPSQIGTVPSSSKGTMAASQLTTLLLRINSKQPPSLEHFQAAVVDYNDGGGIFYEKSVDRIIVFDESKKILFPIPATAPLGKQPNGQKFRHAWETKLGPAKSSGELSQDSHLLLRPEKVPKVAAQAISQWQKRCRMRRLQRRREMIENGSSKAPTGTNTAPGSNAGIAARRSQLRRCQSSTSMMPNSNHVSSFGHPHFSETQPESVSKTRPPLLRAASEMSMINHKKPMLPLVPPPMKDSDTDIEEKILRRREMAHLFQWYYPEGGWGWVVLVCASLARALSQGFQWSFAFPLAELIQTQFGGEDRTIGPIQMGALASTSLAMSAFASPFVITLCQTRSTRLMAVVGGLVMALGILFTSFAKEFHQLLFSYGIVIGLGVAMIRDSGTIILGHYFRKRRCLVEVVYLSSPGLGLSAMSCLIDHFSSLYSWRIGLQFVALIMTAICILGLFYRSASLYHPQRRAILHLKSQKRRITIRNGHGSGGETLPWSQLTSHKRRSVQMIFLSYFLGSFGIFYPLVYLNQLQHSKDDPLQNPMVKSDALNHQILLGLGLSFGTILSGYLGMRRTKDCFIGMIYLVQASLCLLGLVLYSLTFESNDLGRGLLILMYGAVPGALTFAIKTYIQERVKTRDFGQTWSLIQAAATLPIGLGIPLLSWANESSTGFLGNLIGSGLALLGCLVLVIGHNCSKQRQSYGSVTIRHKKIQANLDEESDSGRPSSSRETRSDQDLYEEEYEDDYEFEDEYVIEQVYDEKQHYVVDDNITSCNKVENDLIFSEFEQNLSKESEDKSVSSSSSSSQNLRYNGKFARLWTLRRQSTEDFSLSDRSSSSNGQKEPFLTSKVAKDVPKEIPTFTSSATRATKGHPVQKQRSITVIEEVSTS